MYLQGKGSEVHIMANVRDFDTVNEIMSNLDDSTYNLTKIAADRFYQFGDTSLLELASKQSGLTSEEILWMW